jgi:hypothetical protein
MFFEEAQSYGGDTFPNWPTREEWIKGGRGDLWAVDRPEFRRPENPPDHG